MEKNVIFETTLVQVGNNTGIDVPAEIIEQLGRGKKPPVKVTLNRFSYQSTVAVMGGAFMIPVSAAIRAQAGVKGGDPISVGLSLDFEPRVVALPADFQRVLAGHQQANAFFETLSPSSKRKYVALIESAKTDETRQKRLDKAIVDLAAGKK